MHRHGERAYVIFAHRLEPFEVLRAFDVEETGATPDHEDLADFFLDAELAEGALGPAVAAGASGSGLGLLFGECWERKRQGEANGEEVSQHPKTIAEERELGVFQGLCGDSRPRLSFGPKARGLVICGGCWQKLVELCSTDGPRAPVPT